MSRQMSEREARAIEKQAAAMLQRVERLAKKALPVVVAAKREIPAMEKTVRALEGRLKHLDKESRESLLAGLGGNDFEDGMDQRAFDLGCSLREKVEKSEDMLALIKNFG